MADYKNLEPLLDTVDGMTCLRNNTAQDDGYDTVQGVDWFVFNNAVCKNIYVSGNSWLGFGAIAEQLKVCRRDAKLWYLYRQEGTLFNYYHFLKLRWQGYALHSATNANYALVYEVFLFEEGRVFLNLICTPTDAGYLGTSALQCGSASVPFTVQAQGNTPLFYTFTPSGAGGTDWEMAAEKIVIQPPFDRRYLVRSAGQLYTEADGVLQAVEGAPDGDAFAHYGTEEPPSSATLLTVTDPEILLWFDSEEVNPFVKAVVHGTPPPQTLLSRIDLSHASIRGITLMTADYRGAVTVRYAAEEAGTWSEELELGEFLNISPMTLWAAVKQTRLLLLRFVLHDADSRLLNFQINYKN